MARKNYSEEFRRRAVDLYESTPGATVRGIAEDLGIVRGTLCPWPWQSPHWWPREVPAGGQVEVPTLCSCRP